MSRFVDKLAGALGFTTDEADNRDNDYDDYDEYEEEDEFRSSRGNGRYERSSGYSRNNNYSNRPTAASTSTYSRNSYSDPDDGMYSRTGSPFGSSSGSSYGGSSFGSSGSYGSPFGSSQSSSSYGTASHSQGPNYRTMGYQTSSSTAANGSKILNLNANVQMEVVVASPESFDEARTIAQSIKENKPVIINLEFVEHSIAQRMTDFLCGCCCAVDGNIQRIADKIFMIAPGNVDFAGDVDIRQSLQTEGLAFPIGGARE